MLLRDADELDQHLHGLIKLFGELLLFLIFPSALEGSQLRAHRAHLPLKFGIEAMKVLCKAAEFEWVCNCLSLAASVRYRLDAI